MTDTISNELMYETLKKIQGSLSDIRMKLSEHDQQFIELREQLHMIHRGLQGQIHDLQGDSLRFERGQNAIKGDIDLIKRRLELVDA